MTSDLDIYRSANVLNHRNTDWKRLYTGVWKLAVDDGASNTNRAVRGLMQRR